WRSGPVMGRRSSTSWIATFHGRRFRYSATSAASGPDFRRPTAMIERSMPVVRALPGEMRASVGAALHQLHRPHLFELVEVAHFRAEKMHDRVAGVDQHPVGLGQAFDTRLAESGVADALDEMVGERRHMAARTAAGDHHVIRKGGFSGELDGHDVFGLVVIERGENDLEELSRRARVFLARGGGLVVSTHVYSFSRDGTPGAQHVHYVFNQFLLRALSSVADCGCKGICRKAQAGVVIWGSFQASRSATRLRRKHCAALVAKLRTEYRGRSRIATGTV